MLLILILLQTADIITTAIGLRNGASEANPVARWVFDRVPALPAMIVLKLTFSVPMALLIIHYPNWWPVPALYCASLAYVVWRNLKVVKSLI